AQFPAGLMTSALRDGELVTSVRFPLWRKGHGLAFIEFSRRHGDFAIVSAAALLEEDGGGKITRASLTLGGIAPAPVRAREAEKMLVGSRASAELFRDAGEGCRRLDVRAVRSCLLLAVQANGTEVTTVEGLAPAGVLHPLQEAFREHHGLQCGFCTPGMLTTLVEFLRENPNPTADEVRIAISGNL